jgi:hypothetical protein
MGMMRKSFVYTANTKGMMSKNATRVCGRNKSRETRRRKVHGRFAQECRLNGASMGQVKAKSLKDGTVEMKSFLFQWVKVPQTR